MDEESNTIDARLLDLHLDQLSPEQIHQAEKVLADSPELAARSRALGELLGKLDAYEAPEPPEDLAEAVMARISEQTRTIPFEHAASVVPAGAAHELSGSPVLSLRELIAIAACITLFVGIFVPGYRKAQNVAARSLCREHLRQIWQGMDSYTRENNGYLAYAGHVPGASWLRTRTPNVKRYSNTRPVYMLLRGGYINENDPRVFTCPSMPEARPMIADDYEEFDDFAEPANLSYSSLLTNRPEGRHIERMHLKMVPYADANPLFDTRPSRHRLSPYDEAENSFAHEDGAGQNAVYVDGHGGWFTRPTIGVNRDHIYRMGGLVRYEGTETPDSETDTLVVP